jgi:protein gp37
MKWAERAWDPVVGCTKISPGCKNCMAEQSVCRWNNVLYPPGFHPTEYPDELLVPARDKTPRNILVAPLGDLFHKDVSSRFIRRVMRVMRDTPWHTYYLLTKRAERMHDLLSSLNFWPLPNVRIGTSTENQEWYDRRIASLVTTPVHHSSFRYLSCEPLLGPIELGERVRDIGWVICGCERGRGSRLADAAWFAELKRQCQAAGVPVYHHRSHDIQDFNRPGWLWQRAKANVSAAPCSCENGLSLTLHVPERLAKSRKAVAKALAAARPDEFIKLLVP